MEALDRVLAPKFRYWGYENFLADLDKTHHMLSNVRWIALYPKKNYDFRRIENLICVIKIQHIKNTWFWELFALVYAF